MPSSPGYNFTYTDTTYEATASVECATGYDGTPNPGNVACLDTGYWKTVTGCDRKGKGTMNHLNQIMTVEATPLSCYD